AILKDTLGLVLAKTPDEKALYNEAFDLYFKRDAFTGADSDEAETPDSEGDPSAGRAGGDMQGGEGQGGAGGGGGLGRLLMEDDRAALATAMEQAAREAGIENIRFFPQKNLYARRILDRM